MTSKKINYWIFFLILYSLASQAQQKDKDKIIQLSGVVVSSDSLKPIPFVTILVKGSNYGTISDYYGFFSFVAHTNDVIEFSTTGYKKGTYIIPDTLKENKYSLIQVLQHDTIALKSIKIYPWPSKEEFKDAFMKLDVPDDDLSRAKKNLEQSALKEQYETIPMDGSMNQRNYMQEYNSRLYYAGQLPPNNLLNPIAWSKFIKAWQNGELKIKR